MAISDITARISTDADKEVENIRENAIREIRRAERAHKREVEQLEQRGKEQTDEMVRNIRTSMIARKEQDRRLLLQNAKREILDDVFSQAGSQLLSLNTDQYRAVLQRIIERLPNNISGTVFVPEKWVELTTALLKEKGITLPVQVDSTIATGMFIRDANGQIDGTFQRALADRRDELEIETARILFEND